MPAERQSFSQKAGEVYGLAGDAGDELADLAVVDALMIDSLAVLVRMEDVVLRLHRHVTHMSAVGLGFVDLEVRGAIDMVEHGISPAACLGKTLAVFHHEKGLRRRIGNIDH